MKEFIKRNHIWGAYLLSIAAGVLFVMQAWELAQTIPSTVWDESMYLFKGYLFASGRYAPFADYGIWTNQMPVAYLIPGYIQQWYGPGVEVGRIYAVVVGSLAFLGIWAAVRRTSNAWWALGASVVVLSNPGYMQVFSQSFSQSLVSMLFAWMLFFSLGERRQDWELGLAGFLAALAGMAEISVLPVLLIFWFYVYWRYDNRAGRAAVLVSLATVIFFHVFYWPEVLKVWAYWLPSSFFPQLKEYSLPWREALLLEKVNWWPVTAWWGDKTHLAWAGIDALGQAVRANFLMFFGVIGVLVMYPWLSNLPRDFSTSQKHKEVVYLLVSFLVLFGAQLSAANGKTCQFICLPGNILFIFVFGLLLVSVSSSIWRVEITGGKQVLILLIIIVLMITLENNLSSSYLEFRNDLVRNTFDLKVPGFKDWKFEEGTATVWQVLENKFNYNHYPLRRFILNELSAAVIFRWAKMVLLFGAALPLTYWLVNIRRYTKFNFGRFTLVFTIVAVLLLSQGRLFGQVITADACQDSIIEGYQQVGEELSEYLSDGDQVYYRVKANMLLLELPEVEVYPPQLDFVYTYVDDAEVDTDTLLRFGWWSPVLKEQWLDETDYILVENRFYEEEWASRVAAGEFEEVFVSSPTESCRMDDARIVLLAPPARDGE